MPQRDMDWSTFVHIIDGVKHPESTVSLQGEGEPSLHPLFWQMAEYVAHRGHAPYSILNGSRIDAKRIANVFPTIGVSLDTLDPAAAERIGRHNLSKVLRNLDELGNVMSAARIVIMSVDLGQPLGPLRDWIKSAGFGGHIVQPLERKDDYAKHYAVISPPVSRRQVPSTCRFVLEDRMRFYTRSGQELPCCFIKDTTGIESIPQLKQSLESGRIPPGCRGCRELKPVIGPRRFMPPSVRSALGEA